MRSSCAQQRVAIDALRQVERCDVLGGPSRELDRSCRVDQAVPTAEGMVGHGEATPPPGRSDAVHGVDPVGAAVAALGSAQRRSRDEAAITATAVASRPHQRTRCVRTGWSWRCRTGAPAEVNQMSASTRPGRTDAFVGWRRAAAAPSASWLAATVAHSSATAHHGADESAPATATVTAHAEVTTTNGPDMKDSRRAHNGVGAAAVNALAPSSNTVHNGSVVTTASTDISRGSSRCVRLAHATPRRTPVATTVHGASRDT